MTQQTKIEWTERTWNPIVGCSLASPGCTNCYAMRMAYRLSKNPATPQYHGTAKLVNGKPVFTGKLQLVEKALLEPLKRKTPTTYFVNSMGDLFHEDMPDDWIDRVFAVMALCPQHTFQVLTKRADRMREYLTYLRRVDGSAGMPPEWYVANAAGRMFKDGDLAFSSVLQEWPLPNVWLGVSVEDQKRADERIPDLLATPAAIRFISAEPLLGPVQLDHIEIPQKKGTWVLDALHTDGLGAEDDPDFGGATIDWVIVGGESGPNARPMHPDWARSLRDQCKAAGTAFFFKQWGEWVPWEPMSESLWSSQNLRTEDRHVLFPSDFDMSSNWDDGMALIEHGHAAFQRVGKKSAGRLLDGVEHNGVPAQMGGEG